MKIVVRIGSVTMSRGRVLDAEDLGRRVESELSEMLAREPLGNPPDAGATVSIDGGSLRAASVATPASVAHAIAAHVHTALDSPEGSR